LKLSECGVSPHVDENFEDGDFGDGNTFGDMYSHIRSFARFTSYPVPHARQVATAAAAAAVAGGDRGKELDSGEPEKDLLVL